ncbi:MAG TPA: molybdate ABC transporter substrate-binding protein [Solirubrobacteraceae bacterium]|jgi:molybdate transport system substrate-binding protein|nr:molybdate ABC transporter substrate-binding protein [Solirubrobacteraceae bacterium]
MMVTRTVALGVTVLALGGCGHSGPKGAITVFAASSLRAPLEQIAKDYASDHSGITVHVQAGVSRQLFGQLHALDPKRPPAADVFATADTTVVHDLTGNDELHGNDEVTGNPTYAQIFVNDPLTIVVRRGNPMKIARLSDLAKPTIRAALGSPRTVLGIVARRALGRSAVTAKRVVTIGSAGAAIDAVSAGRADAAIVYSTDAHDAGDRITTIPIPQAQNLPADYLVALVLPIQHDKLAKAFITHLFSPDAQKALTASGFAPIACKGPVTNCALHFPNH